MSFLLRGGKIREKAGAWAGPWHVDDQWRRALLAREEGRAGLRTPTCYCGCGGHSGHRSVRDCFLSEVSRDAVKFEEHGSTCGVCVGIVLDAQEQLAQSKSLPAVRSYIDAKWGDVGPGTDTPLPPE